jgi:S-adenosylmethionine synthetase
LELRLLKGETRQEPAFELVERKGWGHPDTLSDGLAEALSRTYANHTRDNYGIILHHNFDKVGLLGGRSHVAFGYGTLTAPVRVLLNGRASPRCGASVIPVVDLLTNCAKEFLSSRLPRLDPERDLIFHDNLSTAGSPGHVETGREPAGSRKTWFEPRGPDDLREAQRATSNDTSVGCAHWPFSTTERAVLDLEKALTGPESVAERPWLGTDVKVMAQRVGQQVRVTLCIPQIAAEVPDAGAYKSNLAWVQLYVERFLADRMPDADAEVWLNTKDDYSIPELYLTAIGSSIESGDEGLVGRGNRPNGLIAMGRPYSMEGVCGKNPVYHVGKLYNLVALEAAQALQAQFGAPVEVWLVSQEGRDLADPWQAVVRSGVDLPAEAVNETLQVCLTMFPAITDRLLAGQIEPF